MTVEEYLRAINGLFKGEELTPENIKYTGFIDIIPQKDYYYASNVDFTIDSGVITAVRTFRKEGEEEATLNKATSLSDDISLHCGKYGDVKGLIEATLDGLEDLDLVGGNDYKDRIQYFREALDRIEQVDKSSSI